VLGILNVDALQTQAAGTQGTQYLKAFLADQLGILNVDALQTQAAGTQGTQPLKAYLADLLGLLNVDGLRIQAVGTQSAQCLKAFLADQLGLLNVDGLQTRTRHAMPEGPPRRPAGTSQRPWAANRAASTQGTQCLKAFLADQM
jgi:hypothetical protein